MSKSKKNVEIPFKKVTKNDHFLRKKKDENDATYGGKTCFFFRFSTKFQGRKSKFGLFAIFLTPNSNYMVQNLTLKMTKKITFERNLKDKKWGGGF